VNEPLYTTLADAVDLLESQRIAYALIGGLAVSLRAQPRFTADVDLVIAADVDRAIKLAAALEGTSFTPFFQDVTDVIEKAYILPLRHRSTNVKVDMAVGMSGFEQQTIGACPAD